MKRTSFADFFEWAGQNRWVWSLIGIIIFWACLSLLTSQFSLSSLSGVAITSSFLVFVALGQMNVVTTGRGNIDLSIGSVMTLSAYLALITIAGQDSRLVFGLATTLLLGLTIGALNAWLVLGARIPAIIATLATGYVLATATLLANKAIPGFATAPILRTLAAGRVLGVPIIAIMAVCTVSICSFVLNRTAYGRILSALGQNARAAELAGVKVKRIEASAFILSSLFAALAGLLLGAYVGGAFLEMGQPFLLQSLGAVVIGGTLIFGGSATAFGTLFGSILLVLIVTTMQIAGLPPGTQDIVQGAVIIIVLALASGDVMRKRVNASVTAAK